MSNRRGPRRQSNNKKHGASGSQGARESQQQDHPSGVKIQSEPNNKPNNNEANHSETNVNDALIANYTKSLVNWTKGLVFVGVVTVGVLIAHAAIFIQGDETQRAAQRAFVISYDLKIDP